MKFSNKMMLVPAGRPDPVIEMMSTLDKEMSDILKKQNLSPSDKMRLYHKILRKNLNIESNLRNTTATQRNDLVSSGNTGNALNIKKEEPYDRPLLNKKLLYSDDEDDITDEMLDINKFKESHPSAIMSHDLEASLLTQGDIKVERQSTPKSAHNSKMDIDDLSTSESKVKSRKPRKRRLAQKIQSKRWAVLRSQPYRPNKYGKKYKDLSQSS